MVTRSQVMILAHALRKAGESFSDAQKRAWKVIRLKAKMLIEPVTFSYIKDKGELREATGYFGDAPTTTPKTQEKPVSPLVVKYFDQIANAWRSFRADRLIIN